MMALPSMMFLTYQNLTQICNMSVHLLYNGFSYFFILMPYLLFEETGFGPSSEVIILPLDCLVATITDVVQ